MSVVHFCVSKLVGSHGRIMLKMPAPPSPPRPRPRPRQTLFQVVFFDKGKCATARATRLWKKGVDETPTRKPPFSPRNPMIFFFFLYACISPLSCV